MPQAAAAPIEPGERLEWAVSWLGMEAGRAWSEVSSVAEGVRIAAGCENAPWLGRLYPIRDSLVSTWLPGGGSVRYETDFHEGRFVQKQRMDLSPQGVTVAREQLVDGAWVASTGQYAGQPGLEDPVSAVYRLRLTPPPVGGEVQFPLFNGKRTLTLRARGERVEEVEGVSARAIVVESAREGDYNGRLRFWLSEDPDAVPVQAAIDTRAGTVWMKLVERRDPTP